MIPVFELTPLDRQFADFIVAISAKASPHLHLAAALASNAVGSGNVCLNLSDIAGRTIQVDKTDLTIPPHEELFTALQNAGSIGAPDAFAPLVLDRSSRLYLYRYWKYEQTLAKRILEMAQAAPFPVDNSLLDKGLDRLFPKEGKNETDWQRIAAIKAVHKRFCIISGGPGTGKTSTVVKILALLLEQSAGRPLRIALAAPTGKAAARLQESISLAKETLASPEEIRESIPQKASTIHRLLSPVAGSSRFRFTEENLLPFDLVIIDEASMVSLPLMAKLAAALKPDARLLLLGDRDQLASVEAGAVLGDLCAGASAGAESADPPAPLQDNIVILTRNYRFHRDSGIGAAAAAINQGEGAKALALLSGTAGSECRWHELSRTEPLKKQLASSVLRGYAPYLEATTAEEALPLFNSFRVLCALRQGMLGVEAVNLLIEELLAEKRLIRPLGRWYAGRPVLVTANDYSIRLFNGDIGLTLPDPQADGALRVCFPDGAGGIRTVSPLRLPAHETAFAMTIHKSQGSEFSRVLMLLPDHDSELLTRELLYTGITRARESVEIIGDSSLFITAAARRIERASGLREALWPS